jgi:type I restriction enzyme R subunit
MIKENKIENDFIKKLQDLKYKYRPDIRDKKSLELNFKQKFEERIHIIKE